MRFGTPIPRLVCILFLMLATTTAVRGQSLFQDDFNTDTSGNYDIFEFAADRDGAVFEFNYGDLGIPSAPNSTDGSTVGVKFFANDPAPGTFSGTSGVQIVPFELEDVLADTNDYIVTYDVWMNVNGPLPSGGSGSTEAMMVGVGFSGDGAIEAGNIDGTYFTMTGEDGVFTDLRSFTRNGFNQPGINIAPVDAADNYYAEIFPGGIDVEALPVQGGQDNQRGITRQGQMAFQWHEITLQVSDRQVEFLIDDLIIARDPFADVRGNVVIGHMDYFSSETDVPEWNFSVIDNLRVFAPNTGDPNDVNLDDKVDVADIELLCSTVAAGGTDTFFDLNGDGQVNLNDVNAFLEAAGSLPGDADLNGAVQFGDFLALSANFGSSGNWSGGDFDCTGDVQFGDFLLLSSNFGQTAGATAAAVPEPNGLLLAALALIGPWIKRRR